MTEMLYAVFGFLFMIIAVVSIHEWGHYQVARWFNFKILKFSIGMGRPIYSRTLSNGVEFILARWPVGGYVKFLDETEITDDERKLYSPEEFERAFNRQPVWKRFLVVLAGPLTNFVLAIVLFSFIAFSGYYAPKPIIGSAEPNSWAAQYFEAGDTILTVDGESVATWPEAIGSLVKHTKESNVPVSVQSSLGAIKTVAVDLAGFEVGRNSTPFSLLGIVPKHMLATPEITGLDEKAAGYLSGLRVGDVFVQVQGEQITSWTDVQRIVSQSPGKLLEAEIEREGKSFWLKLAPESVSDDEGNPVGRLGVSFAPVIDDGWVHISEGLWGSIAKGIEDTKHWGLLIVVTLEKLISGDIAIENLGGPVVMAEGAGDALQSGWIPYVIFIAIISVNLGVMNLLPIPALDGGHLCLYSLEMIRRKPLSSMAVKYLQTAGAAFLISLMIGIFSQDLYYLFFN